MDARNRGGNRRTVLWHGLCHATAWLYTQIKNSHIGRFMTGYRVVDGRPAKQKYCKGQYHGRPVSHGRLAVADAVKQSPLIAALRSLSRILYTCPVRFYGLIVMYCTLFDMGAFLTLSVLGWFENYAHLAPTVPELIRDGIVFFISIFLAASRMRVDEAVAHSPLLRLFFERLLGVPLLPPDRPLRGKGHPSLPYLAFLLSVGFAFLFMYVSPIVPLAVLGVFAVSGMILTYPEAGAVLSTALLPAVWLWDEGIFLLLPVILLTWGGYLLSLLRLQRVGRFGLLDLTVLIFAVTVLISGFVGPKVSLESALRGVIMAVCISDYFLLVNLMTTRRHIGRCLVGFGVSAVLVILLALWQEIPVTGLDWMAGSRAGDVVVSFFRASLSGESLWNTGTILLLILLFPLAYAVLQRTRRLRARVALMLLMVADLWLLWCNRSLTALLCVAVVTVLYFLLSGPKGLAAGLILLPVAACGLAWVTWYADPILAAMKDELSLILYGRSQTAAVCWELVAEHPAGYGLGAISDSRTLLLEVVLSFGWHGLIIAAVAVFLFWQKGMTALSHTVMARDRIPMVVGISAIAGMLLYGAFHPLLLSTRVLVTLTVLFALCSAYENLIFDESDVRMAESQKSPYSVDRMLRIS